MNKLNKQLESLSKTFDPAVLNSMSFCFMDGVPGDFDYGKPTHTLVLTNGENRSQHLLRGTNEYSLFQFDAMKQWKDSDLHYKDKARNAILRGETPSLTHVCVLRFSMDWLLNNADSLHSRHTDPSTIHLYQQRKLSKSGKQMIRLLKNLDAKGHPIEMAFEKITVLLLWSEFIIWRFEHLQYYASLVGARFNGLVVMGDMLSGDSVQNGDGSANIIRSAVNDAYNDQITFRNYQIQERTVGEAYSDNLAAIFSQIDEADLTKIGNRIGNLSLEIITPNSDFTFRKLV